MKRDRKPQGHLTEHGQLMPTTHWSVVLRAKDDSKTALNNLCFAYRSPLLLWLRCRGEKPEEAEDLVQGFFEHWFARDFLAGVDRHKGRFRTFLLTSFQHFLADHRDRAKALKRGGGVLHSSLDQTNEDGQAVQDPPSPAAGPDLEYDRAWAQTVLTRAVQGLGEECARNGHGALWAALEPVLFADESAPAYAQIGLQLGMKEGAVKIAVHRLRKRLNGRIRDEVLQTVAGLEDLEDELRYLCSLFGKSDLHV